MVGSIPTKSYSLLGDLRAALVHREFGYLIEQNTEREDMAQWCILPPVNLGLVKFMTNTMQEMNIYCFLRLSEAVSPDEIPESRPSA